MELERPAWVDAETIEGKSLVLLQYSNGAWVERAGKGKYDSGSNRIVPDPAAPARLGDLSPCAWGLKTTAKRVFRGRVRRPTASSSTGSAEHGRAAARDRRSAGMSVAARGPGPGRARLRRALRRQRARLRGWRLDRLDGRGRAPIVFGNDARVLYGGERAYASMLEAMESGRASIAVEMYRA